jgi:hypothetical protein
MNRTVQVLNNCSLVAVEVHRDSDSLNLGPEGFGIAGNWLLKNRISIYIN